MKNILTFNKAAFGKRLSSLRKEQQVTSDRLSEMCGVNAVFIRQIESAARLPSLPVFVRLCNELHVSPNTLLQDSLSWSEEDRVSDIAARLRALSPRQLDTVADTVNTLIDKLSELE